MPSSCDALYVCVRVVLLSNMCAQKDWSPSRSKEGIATDFVTIYQHFVLVQQSGTKHASELRGRGRRLG